MPQRKFDLSFWGYVANVLLSLLKPYKQGSKLELTGEDIEIIKKSEGFLDSILKGCDTIESPQMLSFANSSREVPSATALSLAIEIFSAMVVPVPDSLKEFKNKLSEYRDVLAKLRESKKFTQEDSQIADEVTSFFKVLGNKADRENYELAYSF